MLRVLAITSIASLAIACGGPRIDALVFEHAALAEPDVFSEPIPPRSEETMDTAYLPLRGHRIAAGRDRVVAYRKYSSGSFALDDETFEKITIALPPDFALDGGEADIEGEPGLRIVYTRGGAVWPREACFGLAQSGVVRSTKVGADAWQIEVAFLPALQAVNRSACSSGRVSLSFQVRSGDLALLTPWLGQAGGHVLEETHPGRL